MPVNRDLVTEVLPEPVESWLMSQPLAQPDKPATATWLIAVSDRSSDACLHAANPLEGDAHEQRGLPIGTNRHASAARSPNANACTSTAKTTMKTRSRKDRRRAPAVKSTADTAALTAGHQETQRAKATRPARPARRPSKAAVTPASEPSNARLRIFVCGSCSTAEVVPWCGQAPDCGHPACTDALARCAARHQLEGQRFHGPVSVIMIDSHLWDGHDQVAG
jgi:hypothetical protein